MYLTCRHLWLSWNAITFKFCVTRTLVFLQYWAKLNKVIYISPVKVTLKSEAGIMHASRGHYHGMLRAWWAHNESMILCSSGHEFVIIRALYEHLYTPCVLLMLQVCPDNAHLLTSSDLLKVPSFSSLFCHDARILHSILRHHRASSVHHSIIFKQLMLHLWTVVVLWWCFNAHITQLHFLLG